MMDGEPIAVGTAEQVQPLIEEARLARMQAEEAIQRIQQRIERLVSLANALHWPKRDDRREPSAREGDLTPATRPSD